MADGFDGLDIKKMSGAEQETYRLRSGNYRAVFEVHGREIEVIRIATRGRVYKYLLMFFP